MLEIQISAPEKTDGVALNKLVQSCPPLDGNSLYCNILQCSHFGDTCISAKSDGKLVGFVSAYLMPSQPQTLFIWQVAVSEEARGQGLAKRMLQSLLNRPACKGVNRIQTTITPSNQPSQALFTSLAETLSAPFKVEEGFESSTYFNDEHESESLWIIGPIQN